MPRAATFTALIATLWGGLITAPAGAVDASATAKGVDSEAAYHFLVGRLLAESGEASAALSALRKSVGHDPDDPYAFLELAKLLAGLGRWEGANEQIAVARELAPENPDVLRLYGQIHLQQLRESPTALTEARQAFETIRRIAPYDLESMSALGRIYLGAERFEEAASVFREALSYWPRSPSARASLVDALLRAGQSEEAEATLAENLEFEPESVRSRLQLAELRAGRGDHEGAAEVLSSAPGAVLEETEVRRRLAVELYHTGEAQESLRWLEPVIEARPEDVGARYLQGLLLVELDREDEAETKLSELKADAPDNPDVALLLLRLNARRGDPEAALAVAEEWLDRDPSEGSLAEGRVEIVLAGTEVLEEDGREEAALDLLERFGSEEGRAQARRAELLFALDRKVEAVETLEPLVEAGERGDQVLAAGVYQRAGEYGASIPVLRSLLAADGDSVELLFWLGAAYERTQSWDDAETTFRRLLEVEPEFAPALNYLGYMWADRGVNLDEALELVERAVRLEPDNGAYVDSLGWTLFKQGDVESARPHLERAAELVGDDAVVFEHLGDLYLVLGDAQRARQHYEKGLELEDENAEALREKLEELGDSP